MGCFDDAVLLKQLDDPAEAVRRHGVVRHQRRPGCHTMFDRYNCFVRKALRSRQTLVQHLTSRLAPPVCVLCGGPGQSGLETWGIDLCHWCEAACPRLTGVTAKAPAGCEALHSLFIYASPVDRLITQLKFGHEPAPARVMGTLLAQECHARNWELPGCIVPMPLHPRRLCERGFNQSREIARHLAPRIRVPIEARALCRLRHTQAQSELSGAERRVNVLDAFGVDNRHDLPPHVVLLDDVMTTGSTLAAAAKALKSAGVRRIDAWVVARATRD